MTSLLNRYVVKIRARRQAAADTDIGQAHTLLQAIMERSENWRYQIINLEYRDTADAMSGELLIESVMPRYALENLFRGIPHSECELEDAHALGGTT